ncbi:PG0541 family transporter-associated protein [Porphyromonas endodontalis]|uniref:PG0541 family transporter-associated protein n=1 Tax=Porphyromonas endodontalis TaxID=28124 RepID=UPI00288B4D46|nr:PG0541 family transporter-associated protein [Porphyromonas endodontalis]
MRFIYITCNISMLEQIESLLHELEIGVYQVIPKALAESDFDIPHKDTAVWPSFNACLLVQEAESSKSDTLLERITKMNEQAYNNSELVSAYLWPVESFVAPKPIESI